MNKISPCPFCGGGASVRIDDELQHVDTPNLVVACDNPECQVHQAKLHETWEEAIEAWNRRPGWISAEDMLPNDGDYVIVCATVRANPYDPKGKESKMRTAAKFNSGKDGWYFNVLTNCTVTHWMPLPSTEGLRDDA